MNKSKKKFAFNIGQIFNFVTQEMQIWNLFPVVSRSSGEIDDTFTQLRYHKIQ